MTKVTPPVLPTAQEKVSANFTEVARLYRAMQEHADQIAQTRRALYLGYVKAGFSKADAMTLAAGSLIL